MIKLKPNKKNFTGNIETEGEFNIFRRSKVWIVNP